MANPGKPSRVRPRARVRTPTVLQQEAVECGAAALGIILAHHKRIVPLEELRAACGVSRDGSKAANLLKAARSYGLEAAGFRREIEQLGEVPLPAILFWNFNHFLVLEGFGNGKVFLNDPAEGPRVVSADEFDGSYTGVVLTFKPTDAFQPGGRKPGLAGSLLRRLAGSREAVCYLALAGLALAVPGLVIPTFSQVLIDKVVVGRMEGWMRPLLAGMLLTAVLRGALAFLQGRMLNSLKLKLSITTMSTFLWHLLRLPVRFYTQRYVGEISNRVILNERVAEFLCSRLATTGIQAVLVGLYALLMLSYDPLLTLVGVVSVGLLVWATVLVNRSRVDGNRKFLQDQGKAGGVIMGGLATIETLKASGGESDLFSHWAGYQAKYVNAKQQTSRVTMLFLAVPPLLTGLANATVLSLGAWRVIQGQLSVGQLVAFQCLMASFQAPVNSLVALAGEIQALQGTMERLDDVVGNRVDPQVMETGPMAEPPHRLAGHVELRKVTFGYSVLERPLIEGFDLLLKPGSRVALVGPSGCGKSTVAKVVSGLYEPWEGAILLDGRPQRQWPRAFLASSMAMVDQDICLFDGTIRDNLTLWDATVPDAVLLRACQDACIHEDITARQGGYDSRVQEGGFNFSGGQRQRMEIARALVGNPQVLVLDEATSALDTATEHQIDQNLRRRGCTCIIIAHRLSTIRDADEIIVLDKGKVAQRGSHAELMAVGGLYALLAGGA
ncbi:MAG: NHLP family bacteriocin export ABC transporter peptidase/permease/ATPase subunit [Holophaga sp.]|nr:NHLP family bacteriocin export ABC transporter peptidase/permease/ATPase subunit [Holophaga sp.]